MLPLHALLAIDIAAERSREAAELAGKRRTRDLLAEEAREHPASPSRPGRGRLAIAAVLHLIEGGAETVARSAGDAAARADRSCA